MPRPESNESVCPIRTGLRVKSPVRYPLIYHFTLVAALATEIKLLFYHFTLVAALATESKLLFYHFTLVAALATECKLLVYHFTLVAALATGSKLFVYHFTLVAALATESKLFRVVLRFRSFTSDFSSFYNVLPSASSVLVMRERPENGEAGNDLWATQIWNEFII